MKGYPLIAANMSPTSSITFLEQWPYNLWHSLDNMSRMATNNHSVFGIHTVQYDLLHGYGYPPAQQSLSYDP